MIDHIRRALFTIAIVLFIHAIVWAQPTTAEQFHDSCRSFSQRKIFLSAVRDCTRSLELKPGNAQVTFSRALAYDGINDSWSTLQDLNAVLKLTPADTLALGQRAYTYLKMHEYELALADMSRILELKPTDNAALFQRSIVYEKLNKRDLAKVDLQKLLQIIPTDGRVKTQLSWVESMTQPTTISTRSLEADLDPSAAGPELAKVKQTIALYKTKQLATEADCVDAVKFFWSTFDKDSPSKAIFKGTSRYRDYYFLVGASLFRFPQNQYFNAVAYDLSNDRNRPYEAYESSLLGKYYVDRGTIVLKTLLDNSSKFPVSLKAKILHALELGYMVSENFPRSVEAADKMAALGAEFADSAYAARWRANRGLKKYDLALADLDKLIALRDAGKTTLWVRRYLRAELLNDANKPAEAIRAADDALLKEPDEWQATMQKARALRLQKKYPQALAEIEKIFAVYPNAMYIRGERSLIYRAMGDLVKAYADEAIATKSLQS